MGNNEIKNDSSVLLQGMQNILNEVNAAIFQWNRKTNRFSYSTAYKKYAFNLVDEQDTLHNKGTLDAVHMKCWRAR